MRVIEIKRAGHLDRFPPRENIVARNLAVWSLRGKSFIILRWSTTQSLLANSLNAFSAYDAARISHCFARHDVSFKRFVSTLARIRLSERSGGTCNRVARPAAELWAEVSACAVLYVYRAYGAIDVNEICGSWLFRADRTGPRLVYITLPHSFQQRLAIMRDCCPFFGCAGFCS